MSGWVCEEIVKRSSDLVSRTIEISRQQGRFGFSPTTSALSAAARSGRPDDARNVGDGDVRFHPLELPVERQPHLEVALLDRDISSTPQGHKGSILQVLEGPISQNGYIAYKIKTLTDPMDPNKKLLRHSARP